jgi:hypothetical protein
VSKPDLSFSSGRPVPVYSERCSYLGVDQGNTNRSWIDGEISIVYHVTNSIGLVLYECFALMDCSDTQSVLEYNLTCRGEK